jgi:hypothetical protein
MADLPSTRAARLSRMRASSLGMLLAARRAERRSVQIESSLGRPPIEPETSPRRRDQAAPTVVAECPVCMEPLGGDAVVLECAHACCRGCWARWHAVCCARFQPTTCTLCRHQAVAAPRDVVLDDASLEASPDASLDPSQWRADDARLLFRHVDVLQDDASGAWAYTLRLRAEIASRRRADAQRAAHSRELLAVRAAELMRTMRERLPLRGPAWY